MKLIDRSSRYNARVIQRSVRTERYVGRFEWGTLGKSMRGVNSGVPYPNTNATRSTVGSGGGRYYGAPSMTSQASPASRALRPSQALQASLKSWNVSDKKKVTVMKLAIAAVATVLALSSPAFAQTGRSDGLNGTTLGQSQNGFSAGVPYPNPAATDPTPEATHNPAPAATDRTAPVASNGVKEQGARTPKHRKDSGTSASRKKPAAQSGASAQAAAKPAPPSPGASSPH